MTLTDKTCRLRAGQGGSLLDRLPSAAVPASIPGRRGPKLFRILGLAALLPLCVGSSCPPNPQPQDCRTQGCAPGMVCEERDGSWRCVPAPDPLPPVAMLMRSQDGRFVDLEGNLLGLLPVIPCCVPVSHSVPRGTTIMSDGEEVLTGWPIAINPTFTAWVEEKTDGKANLYHARLGPFFAGETAEPEWVDTGGAYVRLVDLGGGAGKADLAQFNPAFWDRAYEWARAAGVEGSYVEVSILDRWWYKQNPNQRANPMRPQWNLQGFDFNVGRGVIQAGSFQDRWLNQIVCRPADPEHSLGSLPNIIFEDGNEVGLGGYDDTWTTSMRDRVRVHEAACGVPAHLFGTNSGKDSAEASVDYVSRHQRTPIPAPVHGRPSYVNEFNPRVAFTPEQMLDKFCTARRAGTYFAHWFHTQTQPLIEETLRLLASGCGGGPPPPTGCSFPQGIPEENFTGVENPGIFGTVVNAVMADLTGCSVGSDCPITFGPDAWMALVCRELCTKMIAGKSLNCGRHDNDPPGATDQISVKQGDFCDGGLHENYNIYNAGGGKVRWAPGAKQDGWLVDCGGGAPPGGVCTNPDPRGLPAEFAMKKHGNDWDSTFRIVDRQYCDAAGFPVGRRRCPVRQEGNVERPACERAVIGDQQWWCNGQPIPSNDNPAQARCKGRVKTCTEEGRTCGEADW